MMRKVLLLLLVVFIIGVVGCEVLRTSERSGTATSNESFADYITIGDKHYIHAWELAVVDSTKLKEIGEVEDAYRFRRGSTVYEIEGYPERNVVAVKEESEEIRMLENVTGYSVYVWNDGSGQPSHYPTIPESDVRQIQVYLGSGLVREWNGDDVISFLKLMKQHGPNNEFPYDRTAQYTALYMTDGALGYNYGILEKDGEFGLPHIESKLPREIKRFFANDEDLKLNVAEVIEGDFVYRLVSEKKEYRMDDTVEIYAELEYIGDMDAVTIYHAASPFQFLIFETTRGYGIGYAMDQPLLSTILKQGVPLREVYKGGVYIVQDDHEYVEFIKSINAKRFPSGSYTIDGLADFYVQLSENHQQDYRIKVPIEFKVIDP